MLQYVTVGVRGRKKGKANMETPENYDAKEQERFDLKVITELRVAHGIDASYEYPGYLHVEMEVGYWAFGTVNETWGGTKSTDEGDSVGCADLMVRVDDRSNPKLVAALIKLVVKDDWQQTAEKGGAK